MLLYVRISQFISKCCPVAPRHPHSPASLLPSSDGKEKTKLSLAQARQVCAYGGGAAPVARATTASATLRDSTSPVNVGLTEPTFTNRDWSAQ
jgi:hypothetical protein